MRSTFIPPTPEEFLDILDTGAIKGIRGGALSDIEIFRPPPRSVRGSGLFSVLAGLAKKVVPFIAKAVKPSVLEFGQNVLTDIQEGNTDLKTSLKRRGIEALQSSGRRIMKGRGRGRKRGVKKRTVKDGIRKRKKRPKRANNNIGYKDVFNMV